MPVLVAALATLLVALAAVGGDAGAAARTPAGFFGTVADRAYADARVDQRSELARMARAGVESLRLPLYWQAIQPYPSAIWVPADQAGRFSEQVDGVPSDFSALDEVVALAARRRIRILPVVLGSPAWAARDPSSRRRITQPRDPAQYARFIGALAARYGNRGTFWAARPDVPPRPVRQWQVWNEPSLDFYWQQQPWAPSYVALLRAAGPAVKAADPGAEVMLGGLTNRSWEDLERIYDAGGKGAFDVLALHPYTFRSRDVVRIVRRNRAVMSRNGDARLPTALTEVGWPAVRGKVPGSGFTTSAADQRSRLREALPLLTRLRRSLRLDSVYWYTWMTYARSRTDSFEYTGLRTFTTRGGRSTPTLRVFTDTVRRLRAGRR